MTRYDVIVVGGGLFGCIIARALRHKEFNVLLVDDARPNAGSKPAACLMRPSWFSSMGRKVYDPALDMLSDLYRIDQVRFRVGILSPTVLWVDPKCVLNEHKYLGKVEKVTHTSSGYEVSIVLSGGTVEHAAADNVVIAAGIWTEELVPSVKQKGQAGIAFLWPKIRITTPFIKVWAPYKQIVAFNRGDGLWMGDGTSIIEKNWTKEHELRSKARCENAVADYVTGDMRGVTRLFGVRPYYASKPCLLQEVVPNLWVASGGAKNGTIAAGWCASELVKAFS